MGEVSHEPSMEEILSSIKRIIAEDSDAGLSAPRPKRAVGRIQGDAMVAPHAEPEVLELTETAPVETIMAEPASLSVAPTPVTAAPTPASPLAESVKPALVSDTALAASRSSMAALSALIVKPEITGSDTLEGMVREMLKPMLAEWLDARLPEIVERQVAQEIARISARG